jgi:MFS family permease
MFSDLSIKRARVGVTLSFLTRGFSAGNFVSRIPDIKSKLELSNSALGICLLMMSVGVLAALGPVGKFAAKLGSAQTLKVATAALLLVQPFVGLANSVVTLSAALFIFGMTVASQDVSMNTHGVTLEQKSGLRYMSRFHAFWSVGGLIGSIFGGLFAQAEVSVFIHIIVVSIVSAIVTVIGSRLLLSADADKHIYTEEQKAKKKRPPLILIMGHLVWLHQSAKARQAIGEACLRAKLLAHLHSSAQFHLLHSHSPWSSVVSLEINLQQSLVPIASLK